MAGWPRKWTVTSHEGSHINEYQCPAGGTVPAYLHGEPSEPSTPALLCSAKPSKHCCQDIGFPCRHVNQKALDEFSSIQDKRAELVKRQQDMVRGDEKIRELIAYLDQRKNEAIQTTFKVSAQPMRHIETAGWGRTHMLGPVTMSSRDDVYCQAILVKICAVLVCQPEAMRCPISWPATVRLRNLIE